MNTKVVVGTNVMDVNQKLINVIKSLTPNKVAKLDSSLSEDVHPFLSHQLQEMDEIFGLKLKLKTKPSMAHSGWLFSHYLDACKKSELDHKTAITFYSDGLFREFDQFGIQDSEVLFLGFGQSGAKMLEVILQAELQFNPNDFDLDGYGI